MISAYVGSNSLYDNNSPEYVLGQSDVYMSYLASDNNASGYVDIDPVWEGVENITISYENNNMTINFDDKGTTIGKATLKSHKTYDEIKKVLY